MSKADITGQRFGRLTAISCTNEKRWNVYLWNCVCDCGGTNVVAVNTLRAGLTRSCGCLLSETAKKNQFRHGEFGTPTYKSWDSMIQRCTNPKQTSYERYGGLGVTVCERWRDYLNFRSDMGERPAAMTLDRIDSNGNYEPGNCKWSTDIEQARNRRKTTTTFEQAEAVRAMYAICRKPKLIARTLGVRPSSVNGIVYLGQISKPLPHV